MAPDDDTHSPGTPGSTPDDIRAWAKAYLGGFESPHEAAHHLLGALNASPLGFQFPARPQPKLLRRRPKKVTYVVRVDLDGAKPPIWRRLHLASDLTLDRLHDVLQAAMGWADSHLHHFQMGPDAKDFRMTPFLTDYDLEEGETDGVHERDVRLDQTLAKPGQRLFYTYDFGDSWHHTLKLEKVEPWVEGSPDATCITGRRSCPLEDVGGLAGYAEALAALRGEPGADPEWTRDLLDWLPPDFDPEAFDVEVVNNALTETPFS